MAKGIQDGQLKSSILKALLYSDIFRYPLTAGEIYSRLSTNHTNISEVQNELDELSKQGIVFSTHNFFSVKNDPGLAERRLLGNRRAEEIMPFAIRRAQMIYQFPFVRAVSISGSLSKNFMDEKSDLDYFVVTTPGRLWIARASMALYKRIFFRNSHRYFCANYFIDSQNLRIEEQNIFTASELSTLIPVCGQHIYHRLIAENKWLVNFYPNFKQHSDSEEYGKASWLKKFSEGLLSLVATPLDNWLLRQALRRWKRQFGSHFTEQDFAVAFKSGKHVSKNHPNHFQKSVTDLYEQKVTTYFQQVHQS